MVAISHMAFSRSPWELRQNSLRTNNNYVEIYFITQDVSQSWVRLVEIESKFIANLDALILADELKIYS